MIQDLFGIDIDSNIVVSGCTRGRKVEDSQRKPAQKAASSQEWAPV